MNRHARKKAAEALEMSGCLVWVIGGALAIALGAARTDDPIRVLEAACSIGAVMVGVAAVVKPLSEAKVAGRRDLVELLLRGALGGACAITAAAAAAVYADVRTAIMCAALAFEIFARALRDAMAVKGGQ